MFQDYGITFLTGGHPEIVSVFFQQGRIVGFKDPPLPGIFEIKKMISVPGSESFGTNNIRVLQLELGLVFEAVKRLVGVTCVATGKDQFLDRKVRPVLPVVSFEDPALASFSDHFGDLKAVEQ